MKKREIEMQAKHTLEFLAPHQRNKNQVMAIHGNDGFTVAVCDDEATAEIIVRALNFYRATNRKAEVRRYLEGARDAVSAVTAPFAKAGYGIEELVALANININKCEHDYRQQLTGQADYKCIKCGKWNRI